MEGYEHITSLTAKPAKLFPAAFWDSGVSLHDCLATAVELKESDLVFTFENGFWIMPEDCTEMVSGTDRSAVVFHLVPELMRFDNEPEVTLFEKKRGGVVRRALPFPDFAAAVNDGAAFEFVNQYFNFSEALFRGNLISGKARCECDIRMTLAGLDYCWNRLAPERRW